MDSRDRVVRRRRRECTVELFGNTGIRLTTQSLFTSNDNLEPYRHAARWIARSIDPFLDLPLVFRVGARADIEAAIAAAREAGDDESLMDLESLDRDAAVDAM